MAPVNPPMAPILHLADLAYTEVRDLDGARCVAILPTGAVEAHGPHLPLATDVVIAEAMAQKGAELLAADGRTVLLLPALAYTAAGFAANFPGTLSIDADAEREIVLGIARGVARAGIATLAIANAHLDPAHVGALRAATLAAERAEGPDLPDIVFPDLTRKPWALRLGDEFKSGACHAGQYEGSVVMAARPELVREAVQERLPANPASLSRAIRDGKTSFEEAGGPEAYFGAPAQATAEEGRETIEILGRILYDAVRQRLDDLGESS